MEILLLFLQLCQAPNYCLPVEGHPDLIRSSTDICFQVKDIDEMTIQVEVKACPDAQFNLLPSSGQ
jgi:hypothetical protein